MFALLSVRANSSRRLRVLAASCIISAGAAPLSHAAPLVLASRAAFHSSLAVRTMPNTMTATPVQEESPIGTPALPAAPPGQLTLAAGSTPVPFGAEPAASTGSTTATLVGGNRGTVTIGVSSIRPGGGYVQVGCDSKAVVASPSTTWPYNLPFSDGGPNTQQMTITAAAVTQPTSVTLYACEEDVDIANSANWRVTMTVTVVPAATGYMKANRAGGESLGGSSVWAGTPLAICPPLLRPSRPVTHTQWMVTSASRNSILSRRRGSYLFSRLFAPKHFVISRSCDPVWLPRYIHSRELAGELQQLQRAAITRRVVT
jgi:hypothetical protein